MSSSRRRENEGDNNDDPSQQPRKGKGIFKSWLGRGKKAIAEPIIIEEPTVRRASTSDQPSRSGRSYERTKEIRLPSGQFKTPPPEFDTSGTTIPDVGPLRDLLYHPSMYLRFGMLPSKKNAKFRGAWPSAVKLIQEAQPYRHIFSETGFDHFLTISPFDIDHRYLRVLVERWFGCTNTLHLVAGEIGPTPLDWAMITGLTFTEIPVPLGGPNISREEVFNILGLGDEAFPSGKQRVRTEALIGGVDWTKEPSERERVWLERRIFLYFLCSCFFNNQACQVYPGLIYALSDWQLVGTYDWSGLAFGEFLAGMRRCTSRPYGGLTGFWQFLLVSINT